MTGKLGPENAIWDDGEWVSWETINSHLAKLEFEKDYPNDNHALSPVLRDLLDVTRNYFDLTDKHLSTYGDIGELFAAVVFGVRLNRANAQGSDGRLGDDHVEVKTITPFKGSDRVRVKASGHFNKLLIVRVDEDFEVSGRMIPRKDLPKPKRGYFTAKWSDVADPDDTRSFQGPD